MLQTSRGPRRNDITGNNGPPALDHTAGTQAGCGAQGQIPSTPTPDTPDSVRPEGNKRKFPTDRPTICPTGMPTSEADASEVNNKSNHDPCPTRRAKPMDVKYSSPRQAVQEGSVHLKYVDTKEHLADVFTKQEGETVPTATPLTAAPTTTPPVQFRCPHC